MKSNRSRHVTANGRILKGSGPIFDLMVANGLTQTEIAERLGVHKTVVNHWVCQGKSPRMDRLSDVAKILKVDVTELVKRLTKTKRAA